MSWLPLPNPTAGLAGTFQRLTRQRSQPEPVNNPGRNLAFTDGHLWGVLTELNTTPDAASLHDTVTWLETTASQPMRYETATHELATQLIPHSSKLAEQAQNTPNNAALNTLAARTAIYTAYHNRGRQPASQLSDEQLWGYLHFSDICAEILTNTTTLNRPADLTTRCYLARAQTSRPTNITDLWTQATLNDPHCWHLALQIVEYLRPAWGGSAEHMFTFANTITTQAPSGSPTKTALPFAIGWISDVARTVDDEQWTTKNRRNLYEAAKNCSIDILTNHSHVDCPSWPMLHQLLGISMSYIDEPELAKNHLALSGKNIFPVSTRICTQANYERILSRLKVQFLHTS